MRSLALGTTAASPDAMAAVVVAVAAAAWSAGRTGHASWRGSNHAWRGMPPPSCGEPPRATGLLSPRRTPHCDFLRRRPLRKRPQRTQRQRRRLQMRFGRSGRWVCDGPSRQGWKGRVCGKKKSNIIQQLPFLSLAQCVDNRHCVRNFEATSLTFFNIHTVCGIEAPLSSSKIT